MGPPRPSTAAGTTWVRAAASLRSAVSTTARRPSASTQRGGLPQAAREVVVLVEGPGDDRDVGALGGEPLGRRRADAAARAGDEGTPAREGGSSHRPRILARAPNARRVRADGHAAVGEWQTTQPRVQERSA